MLREIEKRATSGLVMIFLLPAVLLALVWAAIAALRRGDVWESVLWWLAVAVVAVLHAGFFVVNPNEGKVLQLFGDYKGTARHPGLRWANPFFTKRRVSLRVRNFESAKLKVNDARGNPIEIAAIVVWRVVDTAEAVFYVDDYENYVRVQSEAALRGLASGYPYDAHGDEVDLVSHTAEVSKRLQSEIEERLLQAGVAVLETRISHLAYAPEIAAAMLRRQQATAVVAARQKIVEGAVGMVEMALEMLAQKQVITLDEERKAAMVSNLMVVLCSEHSTQPVVNTGTLHQLADGRAQAVPAAPRSRRPPGRAALGGRRAAQPQRADRVPAARRAAPRRARAFRRARRARGAATAALGQRRMSRVNDAALSRREEDRR